MAARARVGAAGARPMAGAARNGAVARELLVPEQDLAEHTLLLGDRVLRGHGHGRQSRRERPARDDREREEQSTTLVHAAHSTGCPPRVARRWRPPFRYVRI